MTKLVLIAGALVLLWMWLRAKPRVVGSEADARAVLGVPADADEAAIRAAHRRLVTAVHPDRGGSEDLTRRINAARDVLLGRFRR